MLTEYQKAARKGKITSSVAAAALGLDRRCTPLAAWCEITGNDKEEVTNEKAIERGNRLESLVLDYPLDLGIGLYKRGDAPFRRHPDIEFFGDSADATYFGEEGQLVSIGEAKTCNQSVGAEYGEEGTDEVPHHTLIQSQWHLMHWPEVDTCLVPILLGGYEFEFRLYRVRRDDDLISTISEDLQKWHRDYVQTGKPPPAEANDTEWIKDRLTDVAEGKWLPDNLEISTLVTQKIEAAEAKKHAAEREEQAKNRLKMLLGDAEGVKATWGNMYYRRSKGKLKTDWRAVAEEVRAPTDIIEKHTAISPGARALRVYPKKENK